MIVSSASWEDRATNIFGITLLVSFPINRLLSDFEVNLTSLGELNSDLELSLIEGGVKGEKSVSLASPSYIIGMSLIMNIFAEVCCYEDKTLI